MRTLLILALVVGGALAAAWLGGETMLAREARRMLDADPRIEATVTPLREWDRIGLRLDGVTAETPQGRAEIPAVDLYAAPSAPNEFNAVLPPTMTLPLGGRAREVAAQDAVLTLRVAPASGMAVSRAALTSGPVSVDGAPLMARATAEARLVPIGYGAPEAARAAYAVSGEMEALTPGALIGLPAELAGRGLTLTGAARLFLTGAVTTRGRQGADRPQIVGVATDGVTAALGDLSARVTGAVELREGRPEGALFVYTRDIRPFLDLAAALDLIPPATVALAGTALTAAAAVDLPPDVPVPPDAAEGEVRLPLIFREGRMFLGPLPLGPAPELPSL